MPIAATNTIAGQAFSGFGLFEYLSVPVAIFLSLPKLCVASCALCFVVLSVPFILDSQPPQRRKKQHSLIFGNVRVCLYPLDLLRVPVAVGGNNFFRNSTVSLIPSLYDLGL